MHSHQDILEITYIMKGKGNYYTEGKIFEMEAGDLVIKNANIRHGESADDYHPLDMFWIQFAGIDHPEHFISDDQSPVFTAGFYKEWIHETMLLLYQLCEDKKDSLMEETLATSFINVIKVIKEKQSQPLKISHSEKLIKEVMDYLDEHYHEKIRTDDLAAHFYISPYYLMRLFHRISGVTINEYITNCRIGEAQRLLSEGNMKLKDIAERCGFETVQYFHQVFKKVSGVTPSMYRKRHLKNTI